MKRDAESRDQQGTGSAEPARRVTSPSRESDMSQFDVFALHPYTGLLVTVFLALCIQVMGQLVATVSLATDHIAIIPTHLNVIDFSTATASYGSEISAPTSGLAILSKHVRCVSRGQNSTTSR